MWYIKHRMPPMVCLALEFDQCIVSQFYWKSLSPVILERKPRDGNSIHGHIWRPIDRTTYHSKYETVTQPAFMYKSRMPIILYSCKILSAFGVVGQCNVVELCSFTNNFSLNFSSIFARNYCMDAIPRCQNSAQWTPHLQFKHGIVFFQWVTLRIFA